MLNVPPHDLSHTARSATVRRSPTSLGGRCAFKNAWAMRSSERSLMAMAVSTATASTLGIVATFVIDDLGIDREQLGWVVTAIIVGAGLLTAVSLRAGGHRVRAALIPRRNDR